MKAERSQLPAEMFDWLVGDDLNGYGIRELGAVHTEHYLHGLNWLLGPLGFSKFYPATHLIDSRNASAWFLLPATGFGNCSATPCWEDWSAALSPDFFNVACWGVGSQADLFRNELFGARRGMASPLPLCVPGSGIPLAGLAVGMGVMEGADIGAIFSVTDRPVRARPGDGVQRSGGRRGWRKECCRICVVAMFAALYRSRRVIQS